MQFCAAFAERHHLAAALGFLHHEIPDDDDDNKPKQKRQHTDKSRFFGQRFGRVSKSKVIRRDLFNRFTGQQGDFFCGVFQKLLFGRQINREVIYVRKSGRINFRVVFSDADKIPVGHNNSFNILFPNERHQIIIIDIFIGNVRGCKESCHDQNNDDDDGIYSRTS